jgi:hypothetical protein
MRKALIISTALLIMLIQIFPVKADEEVSTIQSLAFIRDGDIWTMNSDGQNLQLITSGNQYESIDWSPDGSLILAKNSEGQIDLIDPITRDVIQIRFEGAAKYLGNYTWSPDSRWIAVGFPRILIFNQEGQITYEFDDQTSGDIEWGNDSNSLYFGEEKSLWKLNITTGEKVPIYTAEYFIDFYDVAISSDGSVVMAWEYGSEGLGQLFFFSNNGQKSIGSGDPTGDWSPDSTRYVFQTGNTYFAYPSPVIVYNPIDDSTTTIFQDGGLNPRWSPDGTKITFNTWQGALILYDVNTNQYRYLLTEAPRGALREYRTYAGPDSTTIGWFVTPDMLPEWSSDGKQITFTYPTGFFVVDASTGASQWYENAISPKWQTHSVVVKLPPVSDLEVSLRVDGVVVLTWTDPEGIDPLEPTKPTYEFRYAATPITDANWVDATPIIGEIVPPTFPVGHQKLLISTNLPRDKQLYFALKVTDKNGNENPLSNQPVFIDSGFRPTIDGYNFKNGPTFENIDEWGFYPFPPASSDFTMEDTRNIFGDLVVCRVPLIDLCYYNPVLRLWNRVVNLGMSIGGHCAGMSASSLIIFEKNPSLLHKIKEGAATVYDDIELTDVRRAIAHYHALQLANPILDYRNNQLLVSTPMDTIDQLSNGFTIGKQYVIAIQQKTDKKFSAHAIVPIAISQSDNGIVYVFVYDNSSPGNVDVLSVNKIDNTWKYGVWSGNANTHSFYAFPLELFEGKQEFSIESIIKNYIILNGPIDLLVTNQNNQRFGYFENKFFNEIPGASILPPLTDLNYVAEPYYILPENQPYSYTLGLDQGITNTYPLQEITQFGSNYALSVVTREYSPQTSDTLFINSDGTQLTYQANESREITFTMALDGEKASTMIKIGGVDLNGDKFGINFDKSTGNLELTNGTNSQGAYNMEISYIDSSGQSQFNATNIKISPSMVQLYENINKVDLNSITVKTDQNQDGKFERTQTIKNLSDGFNPIGKPGILTNIWFWSVVLIIGLAAFTFILVRRVRK